MKKNTGFYLLFLLVINIGLTLYAFSSYNRTKDTLSRLQEIDRVLKSTEEVFFNLNKKADETIERQRIEQREDVHSDSRSSNTYNFQYPELSPDLKKKIIPEQKPQMFKIAA